MEKLNPQEKKFQCFDWNNISSDYLDSILPYAIEQKAEEHINSCTLCKKRAAHFLQIRSKIQNFPRHSIPNQIQESPLTSSHKTTYTLSRYKTFRRIQLLLQYIKKNSHSFTPFAVEGLVGIVFVFIIVSSFPKLKNIYENSLEARLQSITAGDLTSMFNFQQNGSAENGLPSLQRTSKLNQTGVENSSTLNEEFNTEDELEEGIESESSAYTNLDSPPNLQSDSKLQVGSNEIWRFNFRSESPKELRKSVIEVLIAAGLEKNTVGIGGIEVPGGIQIDVLVESSLLTKIRPTFESLSHSQLPHASLDSNNVSKIKKSFTWFKNKSKKSLPRGKTRVIIWISQM